MKTIGLFYAMNAAKTSHIAEKIREDLGGVKVIEVVLIEKAWQNDFQAYDNMIVGASTWFDGELPTYWDELVPELESLDLKGKKVAIFGLGDQKKQQGGQNHQSWHFMHQPCTLSSVVASQGSGLTGWPARRSSK